MPARKKPVKKVAKKPTPVRRTKRTEDVIEKRVDHFSKEVEALGKKFEMHMDRKGEEWNSWFHRTFGLIGPVMSSIFGVIILAVFIWIIGFVNWPIGSVFLSGISNFLLGNIATFFLIFLFFSYMSYFSKTRPIGYKVFSPLVTAISVVVALWIAMRVVNIANISLKSSALSEMTFFVSQNLIWVFLIFFVVGYMYLFAKMNMEGPVSIKPVKEVKQVTAPRSKIHRLYRSSQDRILGGVCGGIAEYLGIDPVIVRLLWIISIFVWGVGILVYIIAWIIIPRNPKHVWDD